MTASSPSLLQRLKNLSLVTQILIGLLAGIALALFAPEAAKGSAFIGKVFVSALKAVAPILVFVLVMASIANHKHGQETHIRPILFLYLLGTFAAAVVAVIASMAFPSHLVLSTDNVSVTAPGGIAEVLQSLPPEQCLRLPMRPHNRSLNLSNSVAVVVFEVWRQSGFAGGA